MFRILLVGALYAAACRSDAPTTVESDVTVAKVPGVSSDAPTTVESDAAVEDAAVEKELVVPGSGADTTKAHDSVPANKAMAGTLGTVHGAHETVLRPDRATLEAIAASMGSMPKTKFGRPETHGSLDSAVVARVVRRQAGFFEYCYEKQLLRDRTLAGALVITFTIDGKGAVSTATASGFQPDVDACTISAMKQITFPAPPDGGNVVVSYPLQFSPP